MTVRQSLSSSAFWRLAIAVALGNVGTMAIIVHQIPFFTSSVGLSEGAAAASVTAMTLMSLVGRFGFGYLADLIDKRFVMAGAYACWLWPCSCSRRSTTPGRYSRRCRCSAWAWGHDPRAAGLSGGVFGMRAFGAIQGLVFTVATFGALIGPVFAGWVYDQTESYRLSFVMLAAGASWRPR